MYSFSGSILHLDLTASSLTVEHPDESFYRKYWGGSALGLYYLLKHTPKGIDPLAPENTLTFALSATTGLPLSGQSRATAVAKSPLTGLVGDAQAGGFWPAELKFASLDAIVIRGKAPKPVYLWVHDGQYELRGAAHLWGKVTGEAEELIKQELSDDKIEVAQIGPAGEKLVRFGSIMNMSNRAHGRTGLGAVMGSKNLKAIAVRGHSKPTAADPAAIQELHKRGAKEMPANLSVENLGVYGTANVMNGQNASGGLPTRNYVTGQFEGAEAISGEKMADTILKERDTCYACVVRCKRVVEAEWRDAKVTPHYGGPEFETLWSFGAACGVSDLKAVALANQLCNQYGADTISAGATIAFAIECFERGLITTADTDGIELRWGDAAMMLKMTQMMLKREGFGEVLAEGSARAAAKIGRGAEDFVVAVKGQELPAHMPQTKRSLGLIYAVNPFGADHQSSDHDTVYMPKSPELFLSRLAALGLAEPQKPKDMNPAKVKFAYETQLNYSFLDSADLCQFVWGRAYQLYGPEETVALMRAATGWDVTLEEIREVGRRRLNMLRAFNAREGAGRDRDTLPKKIFEPLKG
ncbi:MAG: aldehyde ferredoxin oxidoreductase family protein, partial [Chloroflexi bacterium]|nr:aldehyde ferredoxin oxidoreductase family protein [Chloroflexota bacterium]